MTPAPRWLAPLNFDYTRRDPAWADVKLAAQLAIDVQMPPDGATLIVHVGRQVTMHPALRSATHDALTLDGERAVLWHVSVDVPLKVVEYPRALFEIAAHGRVVVALPSPALRVVRLTAVDLHGRRPLHQRAVAVATALAVATASTPAIGLADAGSGTATHHHHHRHHKPLVISTIPPLRSKAPAGLEHHVKVLHHKHHAKHGRVAVPAPPVLSISTIPHHKHAGKVHVVSHHRVVHRPPSSGGAPIMPVQKITKAPPPSVSPRSEGSSHSSWPQLSPVSPVSDPYASGLSSDPQLASILRHLMGLLTTGDRPPKFLIPINQAAGRRYHIPWQILAAINAIETSYGKDLHTSSAGAIGWMQFMPGTWRQYGIDYDGHNQPNPYDPHDAIFSAASYLAANGAPKHMRKAIFAYNHATWYVDEVLWRAQMIMDKGSYKRHKGGYSLPLSGRFMHQLGRTDDGVDIETAPDGAAVYSMTAGIVTAVA